MYFSSRDSNNKQWAKSSQNQSFSEAIEQLYDSDQTALAPAGYFIVANFCEVDSGTVGESFNN